MGTAEAPSPSLETDGAFPRESIDGEEDEGSLPADPLLVRTGEGGIEAYELDEGVGSSSSRRPRGLDLDGACYYDDDDDGDVEFQKQQVGGEEEDDDDDQRDFVYTPDEERAVVRKLDRRLVVFVAALYLISFLDRSSESCHHPPTPFFQGGSAVLPFLAC